MSKLTPWNKNTWAGKDPMHTLHQEMNDWMDTFFNRPMSTAPSRAWEGMWQATVPSLDVKETDKSFTISAELPGMEENDIELSVAGGTLSISGEKKAEKEEKGERWYMSERTYGSFCRSIPLPEGVDCDKADASFKNGVLTVTLPKITQGSSSKRISIKKMS